MLRKRVVGSILGRAGDLDALGFPVGAAILMQITTSGLAIAAIAQRNAQPVAWTSLAGILTLTPYLYYRRHGGRIPIIGLAPPLLTATALLIWSHPVPFDIAPFIIVVGLGATAIHYSGPACAATAALAAALLVAANVAHRLGGVAVYLSLLGTALAVGYLVAIERNLVLTERQARKSSLEHAAGEERRRIAREIHDLVAHSLSITLLYLTGARRELQHQHGDINDAVRALVDAERLGHQAMADIRRTIGLLEKTPSTSTPEPGIGDLVTLIEDFQNAGLTLDYRLDGKYEHVLPSTALGVYRICQESLANIVKHSPTAKAEMTLHISASTIWLSITNDITHPQPSTIHDAYGGAGIRGMTQRAELLGGRLLAGRQGSRWTVEAQIPASDSIPTCDSASPNPTPHQRDQDKS